jgi:hypothetical protein
MSFSYPLLSWEGKKKRKGNGGMSSENKEKESA